MFNAKNVNGVQFTYDFMEITRPYIDDAPNDSKKMEYVGINEKALCDYMREKNYLFTC